MEDKKKFVVISKKDMKELIKLENEQVGKVVQSVIEETVDGTSKIKKEIVEKESIDVLNSILKYNKKFLEEKGK